MPITPVAQEAETGGSQVRSQPPQWPGSKQLSETLSLIKKKKNRAGDVAQWWSAPEFNPGYRKRKKQNRTKLEEEKGEDTI